MAIPRTLRVFALALWAAALVAQSRPPAVPLVAHDPYFSIWSMADRLTAENTRHWTGKPHTLSALARIDGRTYRLMGRDPQRTPALEQTRLELTPTRTIYEFTGGGAKIGLTFFTPALPDDLDLLSRPLTYLEWTVASADGAAHAVSLYLEASADLVVNTTDQPVLAARYQVDGHPVLRMGSREQPVLAKRGDDLRIDWGYLYLTADRAERTTHAVVDRAQARAAFDSTGKLPESDDLSSPRNPVLAYTLDFPAPGSRYLMLAYDDLYSIEYFQRKMRPWWRRKGAEAGDILRAARRDHDSLLARSRKFDEEVTAALKGAGGDAYAGLGILAYRHTLAAHKLVADVDGTPLYFSKENFSNGCIGTVDVFYPYAPFALVFNPVLLRAQLQPVLDYARMERWPWPFAPHDLGQYPQANGQVYGGGERTEQNQMPVEESGNMLILMAALAKAEGNADFSAKYWPVLTKWAEYLKEKGLDPENQLSTDDFAGHLAHNANLSIKAILALASYGRLAEMTGHKQEAAEYQKVAREFARKWQELAADGDHYKLAFDKPGTWSQKYNLVWDKLLGLGIFPQEIARKEMAFYLTKQNTYGLPLDNRRDYTKLDWILWTATLAENRADFDKLVGPAWKFANESTSRVPLTDWYDTVTAKQQGFQARSVIGGLFIKLLENPAMWKRWAK